MPSQVKPILRNDNMESLDTQSDGFTCFLVVFGLFVGVVGTLGLQGYKAEVIIQTNESMKSEAYDSGFGAGEKKGFYEGLEKGQWVMKQKIKPIKKLLFQDLDENNLFIKYDGEEEPKFIYILELGEDIYYTLHYDISVGIINFVDVQTGETRTSNENFRITRREVKIIEEIINEAAIELRNDGGGENTQITTEEKR